MQSQKLPIRKVESGTITLRCCNPHLHAYVFEESRVVSIVIITPSKTRNNFN